MWRRITRTAALCSLATTQRKGNVSWTDSVDQCASWEAASCSDDQIHFYFLGFRMFIVVFRGTRQLSPVSNQRQIQAIPPIIFILRSILILYYHLYQCPQSNISAFRFSYQLLFCVCFLCHQHVLCDYPLSPSAMLSPQWSNRSATREFPQRDYLLSFYYFLSLRRIVSFFTCWPRSYSHPFSTEQTKQLSGSHREPPTTLI
jgi:hypothetical protein